MKYILMVLFFTLSAGAKTITQDGVDYSCKKIEKDAKPKAKRKKVVEKVIPINPEKVIVKVVEKTPMHKNIISGYVVHSQDGVNTEVNPTKTKVKTKSDFGLGVMYQHRVTERVYLGVGVDTNGGKNINLGYGW